MQKPHRDRAGRIHWPFRSERPLPSGAGVGLGSGAPVRTRWKRPLGCPLVRITGGCLRMTASPRRWFSRRVSERPVPKWTGPSSEKSRRTAMGRELQ